MHKLFWIEQPALLFGLSLLVGTSSSLFWEWPWNWVWPLAWCCYLGWVRKWAALVLLAAGIVYGWCLFAEGVKGTRGYFSIASVQNHQTPFHKGFLYKGTLFVDGQKISCQVPFLGGRRPKANQDYVLKGKLEQRDKGWYIFKAKKWVGVEGTWSLAELRFGLKERLRRHLERKLERPRTASFLGSLLTGEVEDRSLRFEFGRLGLQHILAISGFHFGLLVAFCSNFLGLFVPRKEKLLILLVGVSAYFLFIGSVPAVQRSWLMVLLYLIGKLIGRHSTGLNLLGVALLIEVMLDPYVSANLGFQLSFLSCAGILLFCPIFNELWSEKQPEGLSLLDRIVYSFASFLRKGLSVTFAVNLTILPLLLFHFHKFPLLSLLYNLFFPLLVSAALFMLLIAMLMQLFCPPLSHCLFWLTDFFTAQLLDLTAYPPFVLDYSLKLPYLPGWTIPSYLFALFCLSMNRQKKKTLFGALPTIP